MTSAQFAEFSATFPWFFPTVAFIFGACIGSFLNVVIYRLPKNESVVSPGSHCACGAPIRWYDNIPIVSWILLRGKARCCGRSFSFRYPFVELLTGLLFLTCWLRYPPAVAACGAIFVSALIAATFIDLDHMIIPDPFTIGLAAVGIILSCAVPRLHGFHGDIFVIEATRSGIAAVKGLLIGSALVLWIALIAEALLKKEAMGFGDVKFVGAIGAFCGWQGAVFAIFGGALVGTVWFAVALVWQKVTGREAPVAPPSETPEGERTELALGAHVPFGPMLAIAGGLYFLAFRGPVEAWLADATAMLT
jgi:leader peptidase (prepilin peptidase)/N-methyltransferase